MRKEIKAKMKDTADYIFHNPELSLKEYKSSRKLAEFLESEGFKVRWGIAGFETAFAAEWSSGQDRNEQGKNVLDFVKETYHYRADRVSKALSELTGEED